MQPPPQQQRKRTVDQLYFQSSVGAAENFFTTPTGSESKKLKTNSTTPYDLSYSQQITLDSNKYPWKQVSYMSEISKFTEEDVRNASSGIIDQETGSIYGPVESVTIGTLFATRYELQYCKLHMKDIICLNGSSNNLATSILLDNQLFDFDDYKNIIIFKLENNCTISKALCRNAQMKIPIRIVRCTTSNSIPCYRYDGIYFVTEDYTICRDGQIAFKLCKIHLPQEILLPTTIIEQKPTTPIPLSTTTTTPIPSSIITTTAATSSIAKSIQTISKQNVRSMLQALKNKNSQYQTRLGELQQEVSFVQQKMISTLPNSISLNPSPSSSSAAASSSSMEQSGLTSRNKSFHWQVPSQQDHHSNNSAPLQQQE